MESINAKLASLAKSAVPAKPSTPTKTTTPTTPTVEKTAIKIGRAEFAAHGMKCFSVAVSGATFTDTNGYLSAILAAAKDAK